MIAYEVPVVRCECGQMMHSELDRETQSGTLTCLNTRCQHTDIPYQLPVRQIALGLATDAFEIPQKALA